MCLVCMLASRVRVRLYEMFIYLFLNVYSFILKERECMWGGGGTETEGERESQASSMLSVDPKTGFPSHNHEIMT